MSKWENGTQGTSNSSNTVNSVWVVEDGIEVQYQNRYQVQIFNMQNSQSLFNFLFFHLYIFYLCVGIYFSLSLFRTYCGHTFIWLSEKGFIFREQFKFRIISKIWMNPHRDEEISKYSHKMSEINGIVYLIAFGYSHKILYVSLRLCHTSSISLFVRVCVCAKFNSFQYCINEQNWNKDEFPFKNIDSLSLQYSLSSTLPKAYACVYCTHIHTHYTYTREQHTILSTEILLWSRYHLTTILFMPMYSTSSTVLCEKRNQCNSMCTPIYRCDFNVITNSNGIDFIVTIA